MWNRKYIVGEVTLDDEEQGTKNLGTSPRENFTSRDPEGGRDREGWMEGVGP